MYIHVMYDQQVMESPVCSFVHWTFYPPPHVHVFAKRKLTPSSDKHWYETAAPPTLEPEIWLSDFCTCMYHENWYSIWS